MVAIRAKLYAMLTCMLLCVITLAAADVLTVDHHNKDITFEVNGRTHYLTLIEVDEDGRADFSVNEEDFRLNEGEEAIVFSDKTGNLIARMIDTFHSETGLDDMMSLQIYTTGQEGYGIPKEIRAGDILTVGEHRIKFIGCRGLAGYDLTGNNALLNIDGEEKLVNVGNIINTNGVEIILKSVQNNPLDASYDKITIVAKEVLAIPERSLLGQRVILHKDEPITVAGYEVMLQFASNRRESYATINDVKIFEGSSDTVGPLTIEVVKTQGNSRMPSLQKAVVVMTQGTVAEPKPVAEAITAPKVAVQKARPAVEKNFVTAPPQGEVPTAEVEEVVQQERGFFAKILAFLFGA